MNIFFEKKRKFNILKKSSNNILVKNDNYIIGYYDQYKYFHKFEGKLIKMVKCFNSIFLLFYIKEKQLYISFFYDSPLLVFFKKKRF